LTVSSGLENLQTATSAAINASLSQTVTSTPTPTTTAVGTSSEYHSSPKAWIAGLVIGIVAGLTLVVGTAIWCVHRRHKINKEPVGWNTTNEIPGISGPQVQKDPLRELPARCERAELSTQNNHHELQ
jgi:H+/gluconate symporter-like permease